MQTISEAHLLPAIEQMLEQFPFEILGFHADNGSEYINHTVAKLLHKLNIEFTKSRPRHSNDNAMVETFFKTLKSELNPADTAGSTVGSFVEPQ